MSVEQIIVFVVLGLTLALFIWGRWRYDVVALMALLFVAVVGVVPSGEVFIGFGHPAVITVAAVLVLSRGLVNAGVVDAIARILWRVGDNTAVQVSALTGLVALLSGFMNNIGALALLMPVAITIARRQGSSPSLLLMPLAFGSLLGGMLTLIGTPPNIIIANYREQAGMEPFRMFDFLPVGVGVAVVGVAFISLIGWRLAPRRVKDTSAEDFFDIHDYVTEVRMRDDSDYAGRSLRELMLEVEEEEGDVLVLGMTRDDDSELMPPMLTTLHAGDILLVEADPESLVTFIEIAGAELVTGGEGGEGDKDELRSAVESLNLSEVIVTEESPLVGRTVRTIDLRRRYGMNVVAVARRGGQIRKPLREIRFQLGDILLVQGSEDAVRRGCSQLQCLPLADRGLQLRRPQSMPLTLGIFGGALALAALGLVPAEVALSGAAVLMLLTGVISPTEAYDSIDFSIIVLLAAMIPLGTALETTGGAELIAGGLFNVAGSAPLVVSLAILMVATMLLSNVVNNAAAAILVAPIAIDLAGALDVSVDPFLMAVAVAASAAFLTPIGHQSCTLVMAPGGYKFGDYWRMGLPVSILVIATAIPLILWVWPPMPG
ncbi:MAG: SLC13 family permease [Armatimonadota bacterium]